MLSPKRSCSKFLSEGSTRLELHLYYWLDGFGRIRIDWPDGRGVLEWSIVVCVQEFFFRGGGVGSHMGMTRQVTE